MDKCSKCRRKSKFIREVQGALHGKTMASNHGPSHLIAEQQGNQPAKIAQGSS